ncbi:MAG: Guanylyl transferase CofC like, partial [Acidimicrobiaceae bacterium]|nr:Guanylyl transferase CofC like [Acidimicrobiaceae bacterium]
PGSFGRHLAEARRLGLDTRVERSSTLSWDVDLPGDLGTVTPSPQPQPQPQPHSQAQPQPQP